MLHAERPDGPGRGGAKMMEWTPPPDGICMCQGGVVVRPLEGGGIRGTGYHRRDRFGEAQLCFSFHGAGADGSVVFRRKLSRERLLDFLASQPRCVVAMEACAGAHQWGREIGELGHEVRLLPPALSS